MSDRITNNTLSDKLKEKVRLKIPGDFDFSSIGKIDLTEAEKIANEEIVFLSEDDLIDGLENFELIPIKTSDKFSVITEKNAEVKETLHREFSNISVSDVVLSDEVLFEDFREEKDEIIDIKPDQQNEVKELSTGELPEIENAKEVKVIQEDFDSKVEEIFVNDKIIEETIEDETDEFIIADDADVVELDLDEMMSEQKPQTESHNESEFLKQKIDENNFNNQLDNIIKPEDSGDEFEYLPVTYDDSSLNGNIKFIDDSHVEKKNRDISPVFESDPLTENLVRMVDISDGTLLIIDEIAGIHDRIEYILDDTKAYDAESLALLFKEERFMDDSDFDFIDNAIVRDDYTVYIQEIDEYLKSREVLSGSEVYEILGLLPEEIEDIDDKLFGEYYKEFDDEYELEFLSPELSFFNRGYVQKKDLNYFTSKKFSLLDEEKKSIEDDITSESAIIFEEDVDDIRKLLEENEIEIKEEIINDIESNEEQISDITIITDEQLDEIIDITDKVVILEDVKEIERISSEFPDKKNELAKLLSYLDGLLEKLPEETIRKFAESEYFELYSKVLKEIGK